MLRANLSLQRLIFSSSRISVLIFFTAVSKTRMFQSPDNKVAKELYSKFYLTLDFLNVSLNNDLAL